MPRRSQAERTSTTRAALITTARALFAERGYAQVSAEQIVLAAGVTRGALYHHFADKQALFEAVFEEFEADIAEELRAAAASAPDGRARVAVALRAFLDLCERPDVLRIGLTDAPAVLGWAKWREIETKHGLGLVIDILSSLAQAGELLATAPVDLLARLTLSAVVEGALVIANADDHALARAQVESGLLTLLSGVINSRLPT